MGGKADSISLGTDDLLHQVSNAADIKGKHIIGYVPSDS